MNGSSDHPHHPQQPTPAPAPDPGSQAPEDAGTRALADALRSGFTIIKIVMVILVLFFLSSGFFTVDPQEKAIILRFGKPVGTDETALLEPGPHWAFPYPIDEVVRIPIGEVQIVRSLAGWYESNPALEAAGRLPPPADDLNPAVDGYLLTADENIVHARGTLRYRIEEPGLKYTFDFVASSNSVLQAFNNALFHAAARFTVDDILTRDVIGFREAVRARLETLIAQQGLGITIDQIEIEAVPPRYLAAAFGAVSDAGLRWTKEVNQARTYATETVSRAKGEAAARVNAGENRRTLLVEFVRAEATNFNALLPAYERNPTLFTRQRQTEVLQRVLTNAVKWVIPRQSDGRPVQLRLRVNRPPLAPKLPPPPAPETDSH